jgi:transcriptional regulator with XRE-family HTH domain
MQRRTPLNGVRTHRRRWALTQAEVAALLGFESRTTVSRIEQGKHVPNLETVLALEVLFGVAPREMFPHIFGEIEEQVMRQSLVLHEATFQSSKPRERRKRELLEIALKRATHPKGV